MEQFSLPGQKKKKKRRSVPKGLHPRMKSPAQTGPRAGVTTTQFYLEARPSSIWKPEELTSCSLCHHNPWVKISAFKIWDSLPPPQRREQLFRCAETRGSTPRR